MTRAEEHEYDFNSRHRSDRRTGSPDVDERTERGNRARSVRLVVRTAERRGVEPDAAADEIVRRDLGNLDGNEAPPELDDRRA